MNVLFLTGSNFNKLSKLLSFIKTINNLYKPLRISTLGLSYLDNQIESICNKYEIRYNLFKQFHKLYDSRCILEPYYYNKLFNHSNYSILIKKALLWCTICVTVGLSDKLFIYVLKSLQKVNKQLPKNKKIINIQG